MNVVDYLKDADNRGRVLFLMVQHAELVLISLAIAAVIGIGVGVFTYRRGISRSFSLGVAGVILTIPSFALFGLLLPLLGLGALPSIVALTLYGILPIMRNTIVGLRSVNPAISESAQGMGMGYWRRLLRIDLPLAWPVFSASSCWQSCSTRRSSWSTA